MGTFELDRDRDNVGCVDAEAAAIDRRRIKQECIIAFKVYDQCRHPDCK